MRKTNQEKSKNSFIAICVIVAWVGFIFLLLSHFTEAKMIKVSQTDWINSDLIFHIIEKNNKCYLYTLNTDNELSGRYIVNLPCREFLYLLNHKVDFSNY